MSLTADLLWDNPLRPPPGAWQGIARLELVAPAPPVAAQLRVHLFTSDPGYGVRLSGPRDLAFTPGPPGNPLVLDLPELGGRGTYFVTLLPAPVPAPPLHPFFTSASFSFTIDCEVGDCRPRATSNLLIRPTQTPSVDLLTKDFDGFLQLLADRVRVQNPDWTEFAPASFERVLLELLAHQGDMLSYYQDRVANEAFLDTASQRFSVRQHGLLLGYELAEAEAASTLLSFRIDPPDDQPVTIPAKLAVRADLRPDEAPVVFSVTRDTLVSSANNAVTLIPAQWPQAFTARVPAGATALLLLGNVTSLQTGLRIAFTQSGLPTQVRVVQRLESLSLPGWVADPNQPLTDASVPVTRVYWDRGLDLDLRVWAAGLTIHANLVEARHGRWRRAQVRHSPTELDDDNPEIPLTPQSALITRSPLGALHLRALRLPEGPVLFDREGDELVPAVDLLIDDQPWLRQPHLQRSQPFDRHYAVSADNDGRIWLMFGDGRRGHPVVLDQGSSLELETARLEEGSRVQVSYRIGTPLSGNVDVGKLVAVPANQSLDGLDPADFPRITGVTNVTPGSGGKEAESLDAARFAIPASLRRLQPERAVTLEDYGRLVEASQPRVARAVARSQGEPFATVLVLVDVKDQSELDEELRQSIERSLDRGRMVGREVLVRAADDVPLDVELAICVRTGFAKHAVKLAVLDALRPGEADRPGFFHPNRLSFGQEVELSDLIAETQRVPGVLTVKAIKFRRLRGTPPDVVQRIELTSTEVARLDANDLDPARGRLIVRVVGLDDVPEGLFEIAKSLDIEGRVV